MYRDRLTFSVAVLVAALGCGEDGASTEPRDATVSRPHDAGREAAIDTPPGPREDASVDASVDAHAESLDAAVPTEALRFESTTTTTDDGEIVIERVSYVSEGLHVTGQVCRPKGPGPFPVHIVNHGGFSGITDWNGGECASTARRGWVVAESSYRGEDGSDGQVEVCLGEVSDVLRLTEIVRAQAYADRERVMMSGLSHGGCITLRALQRGAPVKLAVDIFGPTDWASAYASWKQALANGTPLASGYQGLVDVLDHAVGGGPEAFAEAYAVRSPLHYVDDLARAVAPLLIVQGTADAYVPPAQACALAAASPHFDRYHVGVLGNVSTSAPSGCAGNAWLSGPRPSTVWPHDRYLLIYDDVGHNFEGFATSYLIADMTAFLSARFPP